MTRRSSLENYEHLTALVYRRYDISRRRDLLRNRISLEALQGEGETVFMNFSVRSSRVTGPKIRVALSTSIQQNSSVAIEANGRTIRATERHDACGLQF
jgi:hypothetical protein